jgi:hypothetical protein
MPSHTSSGDGVLAAPLRSGRAIQAGVAVCALTLFIVGVTRILAFRGLIDALGTAGLGALLGVAIGINDTRLESRPDVLVVRNPLLVHLIPWKAVESFSIVGGLFVTIKHRTLGTRRVRISAVPTGLGSAVSRRKTRDRSQIAAELTQLARSRSKDTGYTMMTTLNYNMFLYIAGCAFLYGILGSIIWAIVR